MNNRVVLLYYLGKQETWKLRLFTFKCCIRFTKNTQNALKYHLVTAEPPFTINTIDCVHHTGLK